MGGPVNHFRLTAVVPYGLVNVVKCDYLFPEGLGAPVMRGDCPSHDLPFEPIQDFAEFFDLVRLPGQLSSTLSAREARYSSHFFGSFLSIRIFRIVFSHSDIFRSRTHSLLISR